MFISYRTLILAIDVLRASTLGNTLEKFEEFLRSYEIPRDFINTWFTPTPFDQSIDEFNFIKKKLKYIYDVALETPSKKHRKELFEYLLRIIESTLVEIETDSLGRMSLLPGAGVVTGKDKLLATLELDGFKYANHRILPIEGEIIETEEIRNIAEKKIKDNSELNYKVLITHLRDCAKNYINGSSKDSISNARHFVEELLVDIAIAHAKVTGKSPPKSGKGEAGRIRDYLVKWGFFEKGECDNLINGVYSYLSEEGSHRGLTEQSCARVSRNIILSLGFYILEKFESWKKKKYKPL